VNDDQHNAQSAPAAKPDRPKTMHQAGNGINFPNRPASTEEQDGDMDLDQSEAKINLIHHSAVSTSIYVLGFYPWCTVS
jgi:hypothetical protein